MNPSILRTVLVLAIALGVGVVANIFANYQQLANGQQANGEQGQPITVQRKLATRRHDREAGKKSVLDGVRRQLQTRGYLTPSTGTSRNVATRAAILAFEFDHNLKLTAEPTDEVLKALIFTHAKSSTHGQIVPETESARNLIVEVQRALAHLGYSETDVTGQLDKETRQAIRNFERARGLQVSGRVSVPLIDSFGPAFDGARIGGVGSVIDRSAG